MAQTEEVTRLLNEVAEGDDQAVGPLYDAVYPELRQIAHQRLLRNRPGDTLNTTALVHEAYLKLVKHDRSEWAGRSHFFATASKAMRFILIDYARERMTAKRGGGTPDIPLGSVLLTVADSDTVERRAAELLTLNDALDKLSGVDDRLGRLVEYRFFGGLTYEEISEVTGLSVPTVKRDWARARTWLYRFMQDDDDPDQS